MPTATISERRLKTLVRETIKETLSAELMKLRAKLVAAISKEEQRDIERHYGEPNSRTAKSVRFDL